MAESNHGKRKYIVYYYAEKNDECVDCEIVVEATGIIEAMEEFTNKVRVYRKVFCIEEKESNEKL